MEKNPYNPITEEQVLKHAHSSMFNDGYRSNFVFRDIRAIQSLLDEHKSAELSELQEKYNTLLSDHIAQDHKLVESYKTIKKLEEAFRELLKYTDDHNATVDSTWYIFTENFKSQWLIKAGLKEQ